MHPRRMKSDVSQWQMTEVDLGWELEVDILKAFINA